MTTTRCLAALLAATLFLSCTARPDRPLPRGKTTPAQDEAFASYLQEVKERKEELHSIMILQHGKVLKEEHFAPDTAHFMMFSFFRSEYPYGMGFSFNSINGV